MKERRVNALRICAGAMALLGLVWTSACSSKKEEVVGASDAKGVMCSYSPSQSSIVSSVTGAAGGSAAAASAIAQATGLTAVLHSSGAYIFTGSAGYVAGTLGGAAALPAIVTVGVFVGGAAVTLELVCAPRNHPELVARVEAAAGEFMKRSRTAVGNASDDAAKKAGPIIANAKDVVTKVASDAFEQAERASIKWSEAIRAR